MQNLCPGERYGGDLRLKQPLKGVAWGGKGLGIALK